MVVGWYRFFETVYITVYYRSKIHTDVRIRVYILSKNYIKIKKLQQ